MPWFLPFIPVALVEREIGDGVVELQKQWVMSSEVLRSSDVYSKVSTRGSQSLCFNKKQAFVVAGAIY